MVSFTAAPRNTLVSLPLLTHFDSRVSTSFLCAVSRRGGAGKGGNFLPLKLNVALGEESGGGFSFSGFIEVKRRRRGSGYSCWCTKECDSEGDLGLEAEILKFMKNSEKPELFPSKKELVDAGRMDLVEAIQKRGGWLALGWDLDYGCDSQEEQEQQYRFQENGFQHLDFRQTENAWNNGDLKNNVDGEVQSSRASSCSPSSSGRSLGAAAEDGGGIEGLLNRLEKERNINFGFGFNEKEISARFPSNDHNDNFLPRLSTTIVTGPERRRSVSNSSRGIIDDGGGKISHNQSFLGIDGIRHGNSIKPDIWRNLSIQRAGPSDVEFEDISGDNTLEIGDRSSELDRRKESNSFEKDINPDKIHGHLEHLELELSSVLQSLRSDADNVSSQEDDGSSKYNLQNLSDALEFQQNEILTAQGKLRSIRAKLAVLEGKIALSIIDTQKIVEQKQRRIDDARRAVQLLRTAYIVWPNSASKVLLAGSFDGWATQRKMERSQTGVFSLYLKLYPGRYEMKFIVDGKWMIDPLRPIVHNNGHENNLLIIT